jgi:hypothetical protein
MRCQNTRICGRICACVCCVCAAEGREGARQQKEQSDWRKRERRGTRNERQERLRGPREDQRALTFRDPASLAPSLRVQREQRRLSSSRSRTRLSGSPCSSRAPAVSPAPRCSSSPLTVLQPLCSSLSCSLCCLASLLLPFPHSLLVLSWFLSCPPAVWPASRCSSNTLLGSPQYVSLQHPSARYTPPGSLQHTSGRVCRCE